MTDDSNDRAMLSDAQLDDLLDASPEHAASADLMRRVAQIPIEHPRGSAELAIWPFASVWRALSSAVLAASLGALSGVMVIPEQAVTSDLGDLTTLTDDDGWELDELEDMR